MTIKQLIKQYTTNKEDIQNEIGILQASIKLNNTSSYNILAMKDKIGQKVNERNIWITVIKDLKQMEVQDA